MLVADIALIEFEEKLLQMADLLGKAIGGLGGGALNSLTNGIHPKNIMLVSLSKFQLFCYC